VTRIVESAAGIIVRLLATLSASRTEAPANRASVLGRSTSSPDSRPSSSCSTLSSAQMKKPSKARLFFEAALNVDPTHYMALYNLGVASLTITEDEKAIAYFEKALAVYRRKPEVNQLYDLLLQLGKLYCRTGRYKKAVTLLEKEKIMDKEGSTMSGRNALLRYLGEAYMGSGRNKEAVKVLQRAIRLNPHDANALSMLGELYVLENQGNDIALSLCQQAVNIDDRHWKHWYRLAVVKYRTADYESSLKALKESMHLGKKNEEALYLAAKLYNKLGLYSKAAATLETVLKITPNHKAANTTLHKIKFNKNEVRIDPQANK